MAVAVTLWPAWSACGQSKQPEAELYERARQSLAAGETTCAEAALRDLLKQNPTSAEAHFLLGILYNQRGDYSLAERRLLEALHLRPGSVPILNNLGVNALHLRREGEAERYFRRVLSIEPNEGDALFNLGLLELKQGRSAVAAEHLRKAAAQRAVDLPVLQALLSAELELGRREAVDETVGRILRLAPHDPRFYIQLAAMLSKRSFDDTAVFVLQRGPESDGGIHALLGDLHEKRNQFDKAVEEYQTAVRLNPENEDYRFNLGYEFLIHHNFDLAERVFSASIRKLPRAARLRLGLSAAYFGRTQYEEAIQALQEAIGIGPESEAAYFLLGRAYLLLSDRRELFAANWVGESFRKYRDLKPQEGFPYLLCALEQLRQDNRPDAVRLLERALQLDPQLAEAWLELGKVRFEEDRYREAATAFEKAVEVRPFFVEGHYRLARTYQKLGDQQKARLAWEAHARQQKELEYSVNEREKQILRFVYKLK